MPPKTPKSVGDPTDPQGTRRPDETPATNAFQPPYTILKIKERDGGPRLPGDLKPGDTDALIGLFLTSGVFEGICKATNAYARRGTTKSLHNWVDIDPRELRTWLGVHIYMTITPGVKQENYWCQDSLKGSLHPLIPLSMGRDRWKAIGEALHVVDPERRTATVFDKVRDPRCWFQGHCQLIDVD